MNTRATAAPTSARAAERAYAYTKGRILRGDLAGGDRLSEGQICADLGLSRTPVHEAFLRLEAERLISLSSRQGAVVSPIALSEARDVLEMRETLERAAAQRVVADRRDPGTIAAAVHGPLERQRKALESKDIGAFVEADCDFHAAVVTLSGNSIAEHFFTLLRDRQLRLAHLVLTSSDLAVEESFDEHHQLAERLLDHDAEGYLTIFTAHLARHHGLL